MLQEILRIPIQKLLSNDGQIEGLPKNPRSIKKGKFEKLVNSLRSDPEMLELRELIVIPYTIKQTTYYVVLGGNMRLEAAKSLKMDTLPCKVVSIETPIEKLRAIVQKDNISYGEFDWEALANEWDMVELDEWALDFPANWDSVEDETPNPKAGNSVLKLEIIFDDLDYFDDAKKRIGDLIKNYPGAELKY